MNIWFWISFAKICKCNIYLCTFYLCINVHILLHIFNDFCWYDWILFYMLQILLLLFMLFFINIFYCPEYYLFLFPLGFTKCKHMGLWFFRTRHSWTEHTWSLHRHNNASATLHIHRKPIFHFTAAQKSKYKKSNCGSFVQKNFEST